MIALFLWAFVEMRLMPSSSLVYGARNRCFLLHELPDFWLTFLLLILSKLAQRYTKEMYERDLPEWRIVRLRQRFFPLFVRLFHELIFEERCPDDVVDLFVCSGDNVISALKFTTFRDMVARNKVAEYLTARLERGEGMKWFDQSSCLTLREKALHLLVRL